MSKLLNKKICVVAGHSGGHIIPCITLAKKENCKVNVITTNSNFDLSIIKSNLIYNKLIQLPFNKIPSNKLKKSLYFLRFALGFFKSFIFLIKNRPNKIISTGGIVSIPVCLSAKILKIPVELYELNVEPGKAVKFISKFIPQINICFNESKNYFKNIKCIKVNYPVKFEKKISQKEALKKIGFDQNKKTIFITGGSQGSLELNKLTKKTCEKNNNIQIIHQVGINDKFDWKQFYSKNNIPFKVFNFTKNIDLYYQAADIIICRAGAGTLAEVLFFNKKAFIVPLKLKSNSHQVKNFNAFIKEHPNNIVKKLDL